MEKRDRRENKGRMKPVTLRQVLPLTVVSKPTQGKEVFIHLSVLVLSCVGRGLAMGHIPNQQVPLNV